MEIKLGEKIRALRKERNLSQEVLAQYLGVSFQAVSKWENGAALPDVAMIPAIALFFGVSTDQLFAINLLEVEKQVEEICSEAAACRWEDPGRAEKLLREGLRKFPGNDVLLNNLLYTLRAPEQREERITICKSLIEGTRDDEVKYDACRILAETYKELGEYALVKAGLEMIPEVYFMKQQLQALLLEGEDMFRPACGQRDVSAVMLVDMFLRIANYYEEAGEREKAEQKLAVCAKVIEALAEDVPEEGRNRKNTFYDFYGREVLERIRGPRERTPRVL